MAFKLIASFACDLYNLVSVLQNWKVINAVTLDKQKKQLDRLNSYIRRGRVPYALKQSAALTAGITFGGLLVTGHLNFITLPLVFSLSFIFSYWRWPSISRQAEALVDELGCGDVEFTPDQTPRQWMIVGLVALLLLSPIVLVAPIQHWFISKKFEAAKTSFSVETFKGAGGNQVTLRLPTLYTFAVFGMPKDRDPYHFEVKDDILSISANYDTLAPILSESSNQSFSMRDLLLVRVMDGKNGLSYTLKGARDRVDVFNPINMKPLDFSISPADYSLVMSDIELHTKFYMRMRDGRQPQATIYSSAQLGVPANPAFSHARLLCQKPVCSLIAYIEPVGWVDITFDQDRLNQWPQAYLRADSIIKHYAK